MLEPHRAPERLAELPEEIRRILAGLRPEELKTLRYLVTLPESEVEDTVRFVREIRTVSRWGRWIIIGALAIFLGTLSFFDGLQKVANWWKGAQ